MLRKLALTLSCTAMLNACSSGWLGEDEGDKPMKGDRIAVLAQREIMKPDAALAAIDVVVPAEAANRVWALQKAAPIANPAFAKEAMLRKAVQVVAGDEDSRITSAPVIADGYVYVLGNEGEVRAYAVDDIDDPVWEYRIMGQKVDDDMFGIGIIQHKTTQPFIGGNLAYASGTLYITTARGEVIALSADNGTALWERAIKLPIKSAPVVSDNTLFIITQDNRLYALNSKDGKTLWTHAGIHETTSMYAAPSVSVADGRVVVPYSSGEIHALDADRGRVVWSDILGSNAYHRRSSVTFNDISALPVVHKGIVYAVSEDGTMAAIELASGKRLWRENIASSNTPWAAGEFLYVLTHDNSLVALHAEEGKVKWTIELPGYQKKSGMWSDDEDKGDPIRWAGPVMAGGRLYLVGSHGVLLAVDPVLGKVAKEIEVEPGIYLPPVVAAKTMYLLTNEGELLVLN